jgi:hypothetical protein
MRLLVTFLAGVVFSSVVLAEETKLSKVVCTNTKGVHLSFYLNKTQTGMNTFFGLMTGSETNSAAYEAFENILSQSPNCESLRQYTSANSPLGPQYSCHGETFIWGVYGQILVSNGALDVFTQKLAPQAEWKCTQE